MLTLGVGLALTTTGCARFTPDATARLSQQNMAFGGSGAWIASSRLALQIESGRAGMNGSQAAGCTSCR